MTEKILRKIQVEKVSIEWKSYTGALTITIDEESITMNGGLAINFQEACEMFAKAKLID